MCVIHVLVWASVWIASRACGDDESMDVVFYSVVFYGVLEITARGSVIGNAVVLRDMRVAATEFQRKQSVGSAAT